MGKHKKLKKKLKKLNKKLEKLQEEPKISTKTLVAQGLVEVIAGTILLIIAWIFKLK